LERSEVDAHDGAPGAGVAFLGEADVGEHIMAADVAFAPGDVLAGPG